MSSHGCTPDNLSKQIGSADSLNSDELLALIEEMIGHIDVFPGFMGMDTIHAIELEPMPDFPDRGCLVVTPSGLIQELAIDIFPGPSSLGGYDYTENIRDVDFTFDELVWYRKEAIRLLQKLM